MRKFISNRMVPLRILLSSFTITANTIILNYLQSITIKNSRPITVQISNEEKSLTHIFFLREQSCIPLTV